MKARDIMTANPFAVTPDDTVGRAAALMRDIHVGCMPVIEDQLHRKLVGVITDRDIVVRCVADNLGSNSLVRDHMSSIALQTVGPDAPVAEIVRKMENAQVRRVPVVSETKELLGIVAQADLAMKLGPLQPMTVEEVLERVSRQPVAVS